MIASKVVRNEGSATAADRWGVGQGGDHRDLKQVASQGKVYEQHPVLADSSNARFVPGGFEVFTPGD